MRAQNTLKTNFFFCFFFLSLILAVAEPCRALTFQIIYSDEPNEGFNDPSLHGNTSQTLGEARKNALARATSRLGNSLSGSQTVRIEAEFTIFDGQEDSVDPNRCSVALQGSTTVGFSGPSYYIYPLDRMDGLEFDQDGNQINSPAHGVAYPSALYEQISGENTNGQNPDLFITFSKCVPYYYGSGTPPPGEVDFTSLATHEIIHGLGFFEYVGSSGDFSRVTVTITGTLEGQQVSRQAEVVSRTIYDEQVYSEAAGDTLVNISASARARAIRSGTGLLWEGKGGGSRSCSYGQRMAELKSASAKSSDGKPRLHAPSSYSSGSSVGHVHSSAQDIMEASGPISDNMDLTLGLLKDIGWGIRTSGFPQTCEPTGITVTSAPPLITTERGGEARFSVRLDSRPSSNVTIPVTSSDPNEGTVSLPSGRLTFTTSNWNTPKEVTVQGVDDGLCDGADDYQINIGNARSGDRFYNGLAPTPSILSATNNPSSTLSINNSSAEEEDDSIDFTVTLASPQNRQVTFQYEITDGTAKSGSDYVSQPISTITLAPCETEETISVTMTDDSIGEQDETFSVTLKNPTNARLAQGQDVATGIIKDDDDPPTTQPDPPTTQPDPPTTQPDPPTTQPDPPSGNNAGGCALAMAGETSRRPSDMLNIFASALFLLFMFYSARRKTETPLLITK